MFRRKNMNLVVGVRLAHGTVCLDRQAWGNSERLSENTLMHLVHKVERHHFFCVQTMRFQEQPPFF